MFAPNSKEMLHHCSLKSTGVLASRPWGAIMLFNKLMRDVVDFPEGR